MSDIPHIYRRRNNDGKALLYAWFGAMHSRVDVAIAACHEEDCLMRAVGEMRQRICDIEHMGNCFSTESELAAINANAANGRTAVGSELESIIAECLRYNSMTNGLFDITVGSFNHDAQTIHDIILPCDGTIKFRRRGIHLNLSGFLKGYALEQLRPIIHRHNIDNALINMGNSSIMAIGNISDNEGWQVAFGNNNHKTVVLKDQCLTTSGNDSESRKHIINPANSQQIEGKRAIAIVNDNAAEGEVLSTTLFIDKEAMTHGFGIYEIIQLSE